MTAWLLEEKVYLKQHWRTCDSPKRLAHYLGRSLDACYMMAKKLRVRRKHTVRREVAPGVWRACKTPPNRGSVSAAS